MNSINRYIQYSGKVTKNQVCSAGRSLPGYTGKLNSWTDLMMRS